MNNNTYVIMGLILVLALSGGQLFSVFDSPVKFLPPVDQGLLLHQEAISDIKVRIINRWNVSDLITVRLECPNSIFLRTPEAQYGISPTTDRTSRSPYLIQQFSSTVTDGEASCTAVASHSEGEIGRARVPLILSSRSKVFIDGKGVDELRKGILVVTIPRPPEPKTPAPTIEPPVQQNIPAEDTPASSVSAPEPTQEVVTKASPLVEILRSIIEAISRFLSSIFG